MRSNIVIPPLGAVKQTRDNTSELVAEIYEMSGAMSRSLFANAASGLEQRMGQDMEAERKYLFSLVERGRN